MNRFLLILLALAAFLADPAFAQQSVRTQSTTVATTQTKGTIAVTNTFQQALSASGPRLGCTIQNNGTHTMYVFFGDTTPADTTTSFQVAPGGSIYCSAGVVVLYGQVLITGTANDVFVVSNQTP